MCGVSVLYIHQHGIALETGSLIPNACAAARRNVSTFSVPTKQCSV